MQELRLVAVSEDGTYLVLATAGRGTRFTLPVDDRLRAAVRGHFSRLGQFEIEVESPLRPKEIQARIRSGETAEEIAESAGIPVERVRWFEGPVLQEREYMAQQAQRVTVRRPGESTPGPPLGETVEERLGRGGVDLEEAEWDSWKCEDNTWRVRLSFFEGGRPHAAEWTFDPRRRHVSPLDEVAARLTSVEWDDDALSDTVTPLVPRRPAMKVVGGDRDVRGLPAEPEQPGPSAPLRSAEPREYLVERGRMVEPRRALRETSEATPLREAAARPGEPPRRREHPPQAPAATRPYDEDDLAAPEVSPAYEASRPPAERDTTDFEPVTSDQRDELDLDEPRAESESAAALHDAPQTVAAARPADDEHALDSEPGELREPRETARSASTTVDGPQAPGTTRPRDERESSEPRETVQTVQTDSGQSEADQESDPGLSDESAPDQSESDATDLQDPPREAAEATHADETPEVRQSASAAAEVDDPRQETNAGQAPQAPEQREAERAEPRDEPEEDAPAEAETVRAAGESADGVGDEAEGRSLGASEPAEAEAPEAAKPAPARKPPAPRQPARTPAKKKPAGRPTMPAAQDMPATGTPAAAAASSESPAAQRPARRRKAKGKRASVPSWDEIMFGARRPE
ncbi:septation protein SepH [Actinomadura chokoriensis]|uniref:Septation protein SepH n=1 Tax=Actinomadura chokoriensis TaxID=454156 RepID=A0ABV4QR78_9ACTN